MLRKCCVVSSRRRRATLLEADLCLKRGSACQALTRQLLVFFTSAFKFNKYHARQREKKKVLSMFVLGLTILSVSGGSHWLETDDAVKGDHRVTFTVAMHPAPGSQEKVMCVKSSFSFLFL